MKCEHRDHLADSAANCLSEAALARAFYLIVKSLSENGFVSRNPRNIRIERPNRKPVEPCRRSYGPDPVDIIQLEKAAQEGRFWFRDPVRSVLKIVLDAGPPRGCLELEPNKMQFTTCLNVLNLENPEIEVKRIKESSRQFGVLWRFEQPRNSYNLILTLSMQKTLSQHNVGEFLETIQGILPNNAKAC